MPPLEVGDWGVLCPSQGRKFHCLLTQPPAALLGKACYPSLACTRTELSGHCWVA